MDEKKDGDEEDVMEEDVMEEEVMMKEMMEVMMGCEKVQCRASARCTGEKAKLIFFTIW